MSKVVKLPTPQVFYIRATVPTWDEATEDISEKSPYRIIAMPSAVSMGDLGVMVLKAFDFDDDHLFGFYDNWRRYYSSKVCYEDPQFMDPEMDEFGWGSSKQVFSMYEHTVAEVFTRKGKKWLMLFDYGDEWNFWLSLEKKVPFDAKAKYSQIVESMYDAPEQYPDYEDEDD